jgi:glycosyltransferase involved in cell wall biosynthesis
MQSWENLLELPFVEKIFLDDGSPDINGIKALKLSLNLNKFNEVRYNTIIHPPHSNFGILSSMTLCRGEYILHIDDDIYITGSYQDYISIIEKSLNVLEQDKNILGINLLTMPSEFDKRWFPGKDYSSSDDFAHPNRYFGTAACLIKRKLLEKVSLADIRNWGQQQPEVWEILVSDDVSSFLVTKVPTPFGLDLDAWVYQSTSGINLRLIKYELKKILSLKS